MSLFTRPRRHKPTLSVCIITRDSADRLEALLGEVACFADEIVVGVDERSVDATWEIARNGADVAYRFRNPGHLAPVRMLLFEYATGDWIFSLDDDEGLEDSVEDVLPFMLDAKHLTHWWLPRKQIVSRDPATGLLEYSSDPHWYPAWQLRIFRNDSSLVWKPPRYHSGYWVMGPGGRECRTSILHYEPLVRSPAEREAKHAMYLAGGSTGVNEAAYARIHEAPRHPGAPRARRCPIPPRRVRIDESVRAPEIRRLPPWHATILSVSHPPEAAPGESLVAVAHVRNTGGLAWHPPNERSPMLGISYHLLDPAGNSLKHDHERGRLPYPVPVGGEMRVMVPILAPSEPGDYLLEWDMVSEGECWFAECGVHCPRTSLWVGPVRVPRGPV